VLINREGFASDGGLIDLEEGIFGDDAAFGWDDSALYLR
jgi:hypothetical protein